MKFPRSIYIPTDAIAVNPADDIEAVCYTYQSAGKPCAMGFAGKQSKPAFRYSFRDETRRQEYINQFFDSQRQRKETIEKRREDRRKEGRGLEVGNVLKATWGYDQTNVDYYEVVALIGLRMVELRELKQMTIETGDMRGQCAPIKGDYKGEAFRRQAHNGAVRITSYSYAFKQTPKVVAGIEVYTPASWTSYA